MKVLALDTTTRAGSVTIVVDDIVIDERRGDERRSHAERLPADILEIANANHIALSDVDLFAVASGPGSFTGLRIGIATMQGLAFVRARRLVGVSALEALAHLSSADHPPGASVAAWMDAHRHEVFSALYEIGTGPVFDAARLRELDSARVGDPASVLDHWAEIGRRPVVVAGDGAVMYGALLAEHLRQAHVMPPPALAGAIGRLAVAGAKRGETVDPAGIQPLYVRRPDAELERERKR
jgi:tRNA threonylcarbamoyladenosine biosynthesis protein TsaB